ncbi:rRNA-processing protein bfr2 [Coemansia sp. RSA 455]|nr:rRNA-processing protein bfr2 [Coemansia sp. RSA 455]
MDDSDSDSDSEGSESEAEVEDVAAGSRDRIRDEIRRLEEGEKALLKTITQTARSDVEKGQHAVNQTRLWEGALDARIRVQKLVTAANELPQYDLFSKLVEESCLGDTSAAEEDNCLENARQSVRLLLGSLVDLRRALVAQSPSVKQAQQEAISAQAGSKRNAMQALDDEDELAATWGELEELRGELQPYRDESLEKWSNKVQISSSVTATKKFKAVNQGIMHQIGQALAGKDRLIERTQLKRAEYKIIGKADEKEDNDESKNLSAAVDAHLKDRDVEIFDDTDFYQQLLRELIESRMVDSNDPTSSLGVRWAAVKQQSRAKKRTMDNKASKGRKIRYHVIEKLQSFMPPIPAGTWHEDMVNELFSSLLGQKVPQSILDDELDTFNSDPSKKSASEKALGQTGGVSVGSQGLRLFGHWLPTQLGTFSRRMKRRLYCGLFKRLLASIVEVKYPNALQPSSTPRTVKHEQLDGVSFEGIFCKPGAEIINESRLPKFGISINGAVCKTDVLPGLLERLLATYPTTLGGKADQHFVGILNVVVPLTKLDVSLRETLILRQFEVECIEAAIVEQVISVLQRHSNLAGLSIVRPPVAHKSKPPAQPILGSAQWSVNRRDIVQPDGSTQPSRKRKGKQQQNINYQCSDQRPKMPRPQSQLQPPPNSIVAPERITKSMLSHTPCLDTTDIPRASWTSHSPDLDSILSSSQTGRVLCILLNNGTVSSASTYKSLQADHANKASVYLIWMNGTLLALDAHCLQPSPDLTYSDTIQIQPEFKSRVCMALIHHRQTLI